MARIQSLEPTRANSEATELPVAAEKAIEEVIRKVEKIETAVEPQFQAHFVEAMGLPHTTAAFPNLAKEVTLPERRPRPAEAGGDGEPRRRRRRRA